MLSLRSKKLEKTRKSYLPKKILAKLKMKKALTLMNISSLTKIENFKTSLGLFQAKAKRKAAVMIGSTTHLSVKQEVSRNQTKTELFSTQPSIQLT